MGGLSSRQCFYLKIGLQLIPLSLFKMPLYELLYLVFGSIVRLVLRNSLEAVCEASLRKNSVTFEDCR